MVSPDSEQHRVCSVENQQEPDQPSGEGRAEITPQAGAMELVQLVPFVAEPEELPEVTGADEERNEGGACPKQRQRRFHRPPETVKNSRRRFRIHAKVRRCPALPWPRTSTRVSWIPWTSSRPARFFCAAGAATRRTRQPSDSLSTALPWSVGRHSGSGDRTSRRRLDWVL